MAAMAALLEEEGYACFLPQRDGLEPLLLRLMRAPGAGARLTEPVSRLLRRAVFSLDVYQLLERCDALVVSLNGRVPDEGAVVEAALAFGAGRPLVAYKHDARTVFLGSDNPMLTGLCRGFATVPELARIPAELQRTLRAAQPPRERSRQPPQLRAALEFGERVWRLLQRAPRLRRELPGYEVLVRALRDLEGD